jgi:hypothetical protein
MVGSFWGYFIRIYHLHRLLSIERDDRLSVLGKLDGMRKENPVFFFFKKLSRYSCRTTEEGEEIIQDDLSPGRGSNRGQTDSIQKT